MTDRPRRLAAGLAILAPALVLAACEPVSPPDFSADADSITSAETEAAVRLITVCDAALGAGALRPAAAEFSFELGEPGLDIINDFADTPGETARSPAHPGVEIWLVERGSGPACLVATNSSHLQLLAVWTALMDARRGEGGYTAASERIGWWPWRRETLFSAVAVPG